MYILPNLNTYILYNRYIYVIQGSWTRSTRRKIVFDVNNLPRRRAKKKGKIKYVISRVTINYIIYLGWRKNSENSVSVDYFCFLFFFLRFSRRNPEIVGLFCKLKRFVKIRGLQEGRVGHWRTEMDSPAAARANRVFRVIGARTKPIFQIIVRTGAIPTIFIYAQNKAGALIERLLIPSVRKPSIRRDFAGAFK